jgi:acyl carrier protein
MEILSQQTGLDVNEPPNTLLEDLAWDSLDVVEIVMELEEEFDMTIPEATVESWKTLADVIETVSTEGR